MAGRDATRSAVPTNRSADGHTPVMLAEVLEVLAPRDGGIYVDGTFGGGGYSKAFLDAADCRVWGIDRDPDAIRRGQPLVSRYSERLTLVRGSFGDMESLLPPRLARRIDGIAFDLGLSSAQIGDAGRGFPFRQTDPWTCGWGERRKCLRARALLKSS